MSSNKEMASFGPSSQVKSGAYHLRLLSVLGFAPTFLFLLLHGIFQHNLFPVLTIVPMSFSSLYSAALLLIKKKGGERRYALSGNVLIETSCGCALIAFLVVDWVSLAAYWNDSGLVMLGTYGTVFPMMNFVIHCWFCLEGIVNFMRRLVVHWPTAKPTYCPRCHHGLVTPAGEIREVGSPTAEIREVGSPNAEGFESLLDAQGQPRVSYDEDAREVQADLV